MSVQAMTWAFEQDVEPNAKLVLVALANRANHETGACHPGQELIAAECSMSTRTVRRHLLTLEQRGLISRRARMLSGGRGRTSDKYVLAFYTRPDQPDKPCDQPDKSGQDQPDKMSERSRPTGQIRSTNRTNQVDQPDNGVQVTVREPKENRKTKSIRKASITDDWSPRPQDLPTLAGKFPKLQLEVEAEKFADYHRAKGSKFADWDAAFRNWCRNAEKFRRQAAGLSEDGFR